MTNTLNPFSRKGRRTLVIVVMGILHPSRSAANPRPEAPFEAMTVQMTRALAARHLRHGGLPTDDSMNDADVTRTSLRNCLESFVNVADDVDDLRLAPKLNGEIASGGFGAPRNPVNHRADAFAEPPNLVCTKPQSCAGTKCPNSGLFEPQRCRKDASW